jgi:hypothetical protein
MMIKWRTPQTECGNTRDNRKATTTGAVEKKIRNFAANLSPTPSSVLSPASRARPVSVSNARAARRPRTKTRQPSATNAVPNNANASHTLTGSTSRCHVFSR